MKVSIIYASTTGNTEAMANSIKEAVASTGAEVVFGTADNADASSVTSSDVILLGSPAMGDEVLEDTMEAFIQVVKVVFQAKKLGLLVLTTGVTVSGSEIGKKEQNLPVQLLQKALWFI